MRAREATMLRLNVPAEDEFAIDGEISETPPQHVGYHQF